MRHRPAEIRVFSRERVRSLDQAAVERFGVPGVVLMENAATAIAEVVLERLEQEQLRFTLIVCGPGNNGGDGLALGRKLANQDRAVGIALAASPDSFKGDALTNLRICESMNLPLHVIDVVTPGESLSKIVALWATGCTPQGLDDVLLVDALFGTGLTRPIEEPFLGCVRWINEARRKGSTVIAVDVPSGMDCDAGSPVAGSPEDDVVHADATVTLAGLKTGMLSRGSERFTGEIFVGDIGAPLSLLRELGEALPE